MTVKDVKALALALLGGDLKAAPPLLDALGEANDPRFGFVSQAVGRLIVARRKAVLERKENREGDYRDRVEAIDQAFNDRLAHAWNSFTIHAGAALWAIAGADPDELAEADDDFRRAREMFDANEAPFWPF